LLFFTLVFGIIELARLLYVINTLPEVTRRAASGAAIIDFSDGPAMERLQQNAIFRDTPGELILAPPISDRHVRVDYLALTRSSDGTMTLVDIPTANLPSCPGANRQICLADPNAPNCIRFVRARVCDPDASGCVAVRHRMILPLVDLGMDLPKATTITPVESSGYVPGTSPCS